MLSFCLNNGNLSEEITYSEHASLQEGYMKLPLEIIIYILEILHSWNKLKPKFLRVSKLFYLCVLPMIYRRPILKSSNFFAFMDSISSNKDLGSHIKELDLSRIVHSGKNASVARLLKRTSKSLELFIAPQSSFGFGPSIALKNCKNLKVLDLSLVSETLNLEELFKSISSLKDLYHLAFPRSSVEITDFKGIVWPLKLSYLRLSGGITDEFLMKSGVPDSVVHLEFAHCPTISDIGFHHLLAKLGKNLISLRVQYPMPGLRSNALDLAFFYCPNLILLEVTVDYISSSFFDEQNLTYLDYPRPLKYLYIESSGMLGTTTRLDPVDLALAISELRLPHLKKVKCSAKLGWDPKSEYVSYIVDHLNDKDGGFYIGY